MSMSECSVIASGDESGFKAEFSGEGTRGLRGRQRWRCCFFVTHRIIQAESRPQTKFPQPICTGNERCEKK